MGHDIDKAKNMKLLLSAFEQLSGLKSTSIKVKSFVLVKPRSMNYSMNNYLDARNDHSCLIIYEFLCIIESLIIRTWH
jgi:hypothetical protein